MSTLAWKYAGYYTELTVFGYIRRSANFPFEIACLCLNYYLVDYLTNHANNNKIFQGQRIIDLKNDNIKLYKWRFRSSQPSAFFGEICISLVVVPFV